MTGTELVWDAGWKRRSGKAEAWRTLWNGEGAFGAGFGGVARTKKRNGLRLSQDPFVFSMQGTASGWKKRDLCAGRGALLYLLLGRERDGAGKDHGCAVRCSRVL